MMKRTMASSSFMLFFFFFFFCFYGASLTSGSALGGVPKFNYSEVKKWGSISPEYAVCSSGKRQSPIDINTTQVILQDTLQPLTRNYHVFNATLVTDGIEVQVVFIGLGGLLIDGKTYELKQMHWHTPSEHLLNGVLYAAELHQVHQAADGSRAVVAILYEYGLPSPVLAMLKPQLDELAKQPTCDGKKHNVGIPTFESSFMRKKPRKYYRYPGSLTTPPCDENVVWNVLTKVKTISRAQVDALKAPLCAANKKNARPTQALNGRKIDKYNGN